MLVKIPKNIADIIEKLRKESVTDMALVNIEMIRPMYPSYYREIKEFISPVEQDRLYDYLRAIMEGYELDLTPAESVELLIEEISLEHEWEIDEDLRNWNLGFIAGVGAMLNITKKLDPEFESLIEKVHEIELGMFPDID